MAARELKAGDSLFCFSGEKVKIDSVYKFKTDTATTVYNLEASGNHNYYVSASKVLVHNCEGANTVVLGHYPQYVELAKEIGAKIFSIPTRFWNKMTSAEQWAANVKFLDRSIAQGKIFRLATPLGKVKPGSFYEKELKYLFKKGYKVSKDGEWLIK